MTQENIEEIREKAKIVDVVGRYVKLSKSGANYNGLCPFHNEKTGSLSVNNSMGIYKCFGCGKSGDVFSFIMEKEKKSFPEAVEILAKLYDVKLSTAVKKVHVKPVPRLQKVSNSIIKFFENRGISNNTLLRMKVTESIEWMPFHEKEILSICFNYYEGDELVNIKFRAPKFVKDGKDHKVFKLSKDARLIPYNINGIMSEDTAIIVEGEMDVLTGIECGIYNICGVPNGTTPKGSKYNLEYLENSWQYFVPLKKIILAGDADEVGKALREELARRLGKERCWIVEYPEGCKDLNDVKMKFGAAKVLEVIDTARQWPLEGIKSMDEIYPTVVEWYEHGYPEGDKCGVQGFDDLLRFFPGYITTVTGIPGHGKDEFLNTVMAGLCVNSKWKFGMCGFEETAEETVTKLAEKLTGKAFGFRRDKFNRITPSQLEWAVGTIDSNFFFSTPTIQTQQLRA